MDEDRPKRQLRRRERERFACERLVDAIHFVEHLARPDFGNVVLRVALPIAHAHLGRLLRDGLVGEDANPDASATLDMASHRASRGLDLARREASAIGRLQPVLAEAHLVADGRDALVATLLLLAVLASSGLQHSSLLLLRLPRPRCSGDAIA